MSQINSNKALNHGVAPGWVRPSLLTERDHGIRAGTFSLRQTLVEPKEARESVWEKDSGW